MGLICKSLDDTACPAWDAFVESQPNGTFFHRSTWQTVIERAFGHRTYYTFVERDGAITGVLPLAHVRSRLFGNMLISTPFCVYGGPLAIDSDSEAALAAHAAMLMRNAGARAVAFRCRHAGGIGWQTQPSLYVTFRKLISGNAETDLNAIPRKQRAMVRKGIGNGLTSTVSSNQVDVLHRVYAESVRNLGTPVFSRRYFRLLLSAFTGCSDILIVRDGEVPLAAVLNFYFRDEVLPYYGGGTARARLRAANDFMYWEVMRHAGVRGARLFDFGRSKLGTGSFAFKKNWGFEPQPLHYCHCTPTGVAMPDNNPLNPKFRFMIAAWKRLPLPLANLLGPPIVRGIG